MGGIGMSALALILAERGHSVSGSDRKLTPAMQALETKAIVLFESQVSNNFFHLEALGIEAPFLVVVSTAIPDTNPELIEARRLDLTIWHRSDLLAWLIEQQPSIAVAGSHGKTTTSTVVTTLLATVGEDPTAVIGGVVPCYGSNGHTGNGRLLVAEADESDGSLVKFKASLGIITNLELDHTDHYRNLDDLIETMKTFGRGCKRLLINQDDPILKEHFFQANACWSVQHFETVDYAALPVRLDGDCTIANYYEQGQQVGRITLPLPGLHNLSNVVAALAACRMEGVPLDALLSAVTELRSPGRRFDFRGEWQDRQVVDDYAHHPSEVQATLTMAQLMVQSGRSPLPRSSKRLVAVFQPHRYSRTQEFLNAFAQALVSADYLILAPIFGAGEQPIEGINSELLARSIRLIDPNQPVFVASTMEELTGLVKQHSQPDDLILAMGAGDVNSLWERLSQEGIGGEESCSPAIAA
jgi:UDP-N-acetylmuramate--alanine ligase